MIKCLKCGREPQEEDRFVWQCTGCKKGYNVKLSFLQKVQEKKSIISKPILKCKDCTEYLDNKTKNIYWKCACGNVQNGILDDFSQKLNTDNDIIDFFNSDNNDFCSSCGTKLQPDQKFCPNCGKNTAGKSERFCVKCGEIVSGDKRYCPNCGHKMPLNIETGKHLNTGFIKKLTVIVISLVFVVGIVFAGKTYIPKIFVSTEELLEEGNYEKAYKKAKKEEKENILIENLIAFVCGDVEKKLKDPSSFFLSEIYYEKTNPRRIILTVSGKNGMGGVSSSFWLYNFDTNKNQYACMGSVSDMEDEEASSYDSEDELMEKLVNNIIRTSIRDALNTAEELDNTLINHINNLHEEKLLNTVKLLDNISDIYPTDGDDL